MGPPDTLVVYSDYVCPFCYLGRKSLEQYERTREDALDVAWHPFDLRASRRGPDGALDRTADDGKDEQYYEQARANVRRLQERYGVEMERDLATDVDSLDAQVASVYVQETHPDHWRAFDDAVLEALWQDDRDIGDVDVLADIAADQGLDPVEIREAVADETLRDRVFAQFDQATQQGITGVPTFVYGGQAARGAVPPEHLARLVEGE